MRRGEIAFEQQAHRIALIAEGRLYADEDVAELGAIDMDRAAIALLAAGRWAPLRLDLLEVRFGADMGVRRNPRRHIGVRTEAFRIALEDGIAQRLDACRHIDPVALRSQTHQRGMERLVNREMRRRSGGSGIGRKIEQDHGQLALRPVDLAQADELDRLRRQRIGPLGMAAHGPDRAFAIVAAPTEDAGADRAVKLGDGNHHGGFDGQEAQPATLPLFE